MRVQTRRSIALALALALVLLGVGAWAQTTVQIFDGKIVVRSTAADAVKVLGGITAGSGNVAIVNTAGKIPALTSTYVADLSGAALTSLNASQLTSGTVPLARLSGITNTEISASAAIAYSKLNLAGAIVNADVSTSAAIAYSKLALTDSIVNADINASAAIAWSKISKTGSSLADLATRSASDLSSGTLASARLSGAYTGISNVGVLADLSVSGAATLSSTLAVTGATTLSSTLTVGEALSQTKFISGQGTTTFKSERRSSSPYEWTLDLSGSGNQTLGISFAGAASAYTFSSTAFTASAFGSHTFSAGGTGTNSLSVVNPTAGTSNQASVIVGSDASATLGQLTAYASTFTTAGANVASGVKIQGSGVGGINVVASHASGDIGFYAGNTTTLRGSMTDAGLFDWNGAITAGSGNVGIIDATGKIPALTSTYFASVDASTLTALNASQLTTGTVPLARLAGITNTEIAAAAAIAYSKLNLAGSIVNADVSTSAAIAYSKLALTDSIVNADINASAAIAWSKISKTGSSLADLATRSASDLSSGTLPPARFPTGFIALFDTSCPSGWTRFTTLDNKFPRGGATYSAAGGGSDTHEHDVDPASVTSTSSGAHTHTGTTDTDGAHAHTGETVAEGSDVTVANIVSSGAHAHAFTTDSGGSHTHDVNIPSTATTSESNVPAYVQMVFCKAA